jgi:hypothetical protein
MINEGIAAHLVLHHDDVAGKVLFDPLSAGQQRSLNFIRAQVRDVLRQIAVEFDEVRQRRSRGIDFGRGSAAYERCGTVLRATREGAPAALAQPSPRNRI